MKLYLSKCFTNIIKFSNAISITANATVGVAVGVTISITVGITVKDSWFYPVAVIIAIYVYIFIINNIR